MTKVLAAVSLSFVCVLLACLPGESPQPVTFAFAGDVMLGRGVAQALDGDWEAALAAVQPWLAEADLAFANLESPLTTAPPDASRVGQGYDLRAPPEAVAALRAAGLDVVSLANNHALDAGEAGLAETLAALRAAGIEGALNEDSGIARQPTRYQLLAFDDSALPLDVEAAARAVAAAAGRAGPVIVSMHWGGEYQAAPSPRQRAIARALAEAGADLVVGHGPHVLQRMEWMENTLVAYSLGNLLFDQRYPADCRRGAILRVTARGHRIVGVEALPTVVENGRARPANGEEALAIRQSYSLVNPPHQ